MKEINMLYSQLLIALVFKPLNQKVIIIIIIIIIYEEDLGRRGMRYWENGENCITRSFVICALRPV
jgi:hypothetical protein